MVESVRGLHNFALKPQVVRRNPQFTSSISGNHYLAPDDWETIYDVKPLYGAGLTGSGVTIAVMGQSNVLLSDIQTFRTAAGLPANNPTVVVPPDDVDPGIQSGDEIESDLDLEWAGGIARNATILFVAASAIFGNGVDDSITYAIDNNVAPIISLSYGICEADDSPDDIATEDSLYQQANTQGITILVASGDAGATACDQGLNEGAATQGLAVNYPASSPYVTAVGGTEFNEGGGTYCSTTNNSYNGSALSYIPEKVWNDGFQSAGGGGASAVETKPDWQVGPGVPNDSARDVPDVAFAASAGHDGILICSEGSCVDGFRDAQSDLTVVGGTSAGAPSFAGLLALVVELNGAGTRLGNINPSLYSLAQVSTNAFHDVTVGNNEAPCEAGTTDCPSGGNIGYVAGVGYDQASGLGSVDGYNFAEQWFGNLGFGAAPGLGFIPITPCRLIDTRGATGALGGPSLTALSTRSFPLPAGSCGLPGGPSAYSLNITVVPKVNLGYLSLWPSGQAQPVVSTLNSLDGRIVANAAIVPAGVGGAVSVYVTDATDVIIDVNGYFAATDTVGALYFVPVTPCRVEDTRNANGTFGGPIWRPMRRVRSRCQAAAVPYRQRLALIR